MKVKTSSIKLKTSVKVLDEILKEPSSFIANWPYVVKVIGREHPVVEIMLPRFVFRFRDFYEFEFYSGKNEYIYNGFGKKGDLTVVIHLKRMKSYILAKIKITYIGKREFMLGKPLEILANGIAKSLKELAQASRVVVGKKTKEAIVSVDFSDPMSVANFLAKAKMFHSGLHVVQEGKLIEIIQDLMGKSGSDVLYVSGITSDGRRSFKVILNGSQIIAVEIRNEGGLKTIKVKNEESAREAMGLLLSVSGAYMLNAWVPAGGV